MGYSAQAKGRFSTILEGQQLVARSEPTHAASDLDKLMWREMFSIKQTSDLPDWHYNASRM